MPGTDEDEQLALYVMQELSYRQIDGVDPAWEEDPSLLSLRRMLEARLERRLRASCATPTCNPGQVADAMIKLIDDADGPSLSSWVEAHGTIDHLREFAVHRSAYQLKEADPHSFVIPRLPAGATKTAVLEIQFDEYGGAVPTEAHAALFAGTMREFGLDASPGAYVDLLPAVTLRTNTLLNLLGRSRRLAGACIGHLAVFEMTSVEPMARYAAAVRRILPGGDGTRAARFYDVHVAADGHHATVAKRMVRDLVIELPELAGEVLFGAAALMHVEQCLAEHLLDRWQAGRTSLRAPLPGSRLRPDDVDYAEAG